MSIVVTINEVAQRAGVSASTVSHVLNKTRPVNADTRERVERAVEELGYRRSAVARTLAGGKSNTIGLVISGLSNAYFGPLLAAIERGVTAAGYVLVIGDSHDEAAMEQRVVESLLDRHVDGLLVAPSPGFLESSAALVAQAGTPVVAIDRSIDFACDQVVPENRAAVRALTEHLLWHGHTRIGVMVGLPGLDSSEERLAGYLEALEQRGLTAEEALMAVADSGSDQARAAVLEMFSAPHSPSALLTLNNAMTIGALRGLKDLGLAVPRDVALVSYDDFEWSDLFEPGLTAVAQDIDAMGALAVERLLARINGDTQAAQTHVIPTDFRLRSSCGCPG